MNIGILLLVIAGAELGLGIWFLAKYPRNQTMLWYGLFAISSAIYVGANGFGYLLSITYGGKAEDFAWTGGMMATIFFLAFSFSFPYPRRTIRELLPLVVWPLAIFVPGLLFSNAFIVQRTIVHFGDGYKTAQGHYIAFLLVFFCVYWAWSIFNMVSTYLRSDGIMKRNIGVIAIGTIISLGATMYCDLFLPLNSVDQVGYIGSLMTAVWLGAATYVLLKR